MSHQIFSYVQNSLLPRIAAEIHHGAWPRELDAGAIVADSLAKMRKTAWKNSIS